MSDDRHHAVSRRAYELWEQGGGEHGRHDEHWHQARLELEGGSGDAPAPHTAEEVAATAEELNGLPSGDPVAPDGTTMDAAAVVKPGKAAKPKAAPATTRTRKVKQTG